MTGRVAVVAALGALVLMALWFLHVGAVLGQSFGYVPQIAPYHSHTPELDKLYSTWRRPVERGPKGERLYSCCSRMDCAPVELRFRGGKWYAVGHPASYGREVEIPEVLFEENYADGPESPDGRSHVCLSLSTRKPLCALRGSGT